MWPSYTQRPRQVIPRAAALEVTAAKIVIYCSDINQTAPSFLLSPNPSLLSSLLTLVATIPQRKTNIDLSYSFNLLRLALDACISIHSTHRCTHKHTAGGSSFTPSCSCKFLNSYLTAVSQCIYLLYRFLQALSYILLILINCDTTYIWRRDFTFAALLWCFLVETLMLPHPGVWIYFSWQKTPVQKN